jgi:type III restriction enzyme
MTLTSPKKYQATAIRKLVNHLSKMLLLTIKEDRLVIFKSPTGSGKTMMITNALSQLIESPITPPFIVLWLSPGKGDLHKQSARSLNRMLSDSSLIVTLLESRDDLANNDDPASGTLFVVNWEKLRTEKDGVWANRLLRNGETSNFFTVLENSARQGLDLIVVVDESHTNLDGPQTSKLMKAIEKVRSFVLVEMSATPSSQIDDDLEAEGRQAKIVVTFNSVEAEGMVRKSILLNPDFEEVQTKHPDLSIDLQVLNAAWDRNVLLTDAFISLGSRVRPLLLIQYPDGAKAKIRAVVVEKFLESKGLTKDVSYATWLSGDHSDDLENIADNNSPYKALIFKQAIATGWDCPRAQVLVQFREPGSDTFRIQTLGRILRSPEHKHYEDENLNVAFVYSDLAGVSVNIVTDEPDITFRDLPTYRSTAYPPTGLSLSSVFQPRRRDFHYPIVENLSGPFIETLNREVSSLLPTEPIRNSSSRILADAEMSIREVMSNGDVNFEGVELSGILGEQLAQFLYDQILVTKIGPYRSREQTRPRVKTLMVKWVALHRPDWMPDEIQHFVLANAAAITDTINTACMIAKEADESQAIAEARAKRRVTKPWEIPLSELVSSTNSDLSNAEGYLFSPSALSRTRSEPEKLFESWLKKGHTDGKIEWWWKNGKRDEKYLGVEFEFPISGKSLDEICYPDYLFLDSSSNLWVLEVKGVNDLHGSVGGLTHAKALGLDAWATTTSQSWKDNPTVNSCSDIRAGVVVPIQDGHGGVIVKLANAKSWQPPSPENIVKPSYWSILEIALAEIE